MQHTDQGRSALPAADADSLRHSRRVADFVHAGIRAAGGSISFAEFMQHVLYAPGLGYYSAGARKLGAGGDFVTAPEVSPLFGRVLARQLAPLLRENRGRELLELGAGSGTLIVQLLGSLRELDALPAHCRILEVSADLRERQQARIARELPGFDARVSWIDSLPRNFRGVVVANEVADALPVERFVRTAGGVEQLRVASGRDGFVLARAPAPAYLERAVAEIETGLRRRLPAGYVSEVSTGLPGWIGDIAASLEEAFVFLFDYGVARHEYYAPDRDGGWLRCHFRHRAHDDPLCHPGIQDLTAWVDFTAVAHAAASAGMVVAGYVTQSRFLLDGGLLDEMAARESSAAAAQLELSRQVKLLTLPGEMGEHFKCLGLSTGNVMQPDALRAGDRAHVL